MNDRVAKKKPLAALYKLHRVLMGTGIMCSLVMAIWGIRQFRANHEASSLVVSAFGVAVAVGLGFYLRYFNAKIAR